MLRVFATLCWLVAGVGLVMVVAAAISRAIKRLVRLSDETVSDPWFRRNDISGLSWALHWMRPGLVLLIIGVAFAVVAEALG